MEKTGNFTTNTIAIEDIDQHLRCPPISLKGISGGYHQVENVILKIRIPVPDFWIERKELLAKWKKWIN